MRTEQESRAWRPELEGWSDDILPFYFSIAKALPNPCTVVEVGVAKGRSAIYLASALLELGHSDASRIFMVDCWEGDWVRECLPSVVGHATRAELGLLCPVRARSATAALMFPDGGDELPIIDLLFIDGDHSYELCKDDLLQWSPRVRSGGIIAGHDYAPEYPGVRKAVDEVVEDYSRTLEHPTRSVWRLR